MTYSSGQLVPLIVLCLSGFSNRIEAQAPASRVEFNRDIRPILSNRCFKCHGPDDETREADLRLDTYEGATQDASRAAPAVVPGKPNASELLARITTRDSDLRMPPVDEGPALSAEQVQTLQRWIEQGAAYDLHWSLRPLADSVVPAPRVLKDWIRNPIDGFVAAALVREGLSPAPEADRSTLIRRLYLDLLGVPPSPDQAQAFCADTRVDAYEQLVDQVLSDPQFGERWGRYWLDQARYADTNGYTVDSPRTLWPYRDWVIGALNSDMPFDQFTIEQLAGDLLERPTLEQRIATGFHRNSLVNQEGGSDREQFRNEAAVDRVNTTGAVWLGLTVACSQCHTHKFDPISQREYYSLFAFFNQAEDANSIAPVLEVVSESERRRLAELDQQLRLRQQALAEYDRSNNARLPESEQDDGQPLDWTVVSPLNIRAQQSATLELLQDQSILASGELASSETYDLTFQSAERISGIRIETLTHPSLPRGGPGRAANGNFVLGELELRADPSESRQATSGPPIAFQFAQADHSQPKYPVRDAIDGKLDTGWAINVSRGNMNVARTASFVLQEVAEPGRYTLRLRFSSQPAKYQIGRFRIAVTGAAFSKFPLPDSRRESLAKLVTQAQAARDKYAASFPKTMVMRDLAQRRDTHLHIRGDFLRKGELVVPDTPAVLPPLNPRQAFADRLDLARWLVRADHPLTSRVAINRIWMRLFGRGLVETENDFGSQGTPPTHPKLLDWLARDWMDRGWSLKGTIRQLVLSSTYRQASLASPESRDRDPRNLWLSHQNRLRLEAESIRDTLLSVSGLLTREVGGPSVYPPQPAGVYAFTQRKANWPTSQGGDRYRKGLYTFFMRSAPYPMLTTFDTPRFNTTCTQRVRTNTPLQALTLANDETVMEMAQALGRQLFERDRKGEADAIEWVFWKAFSRSPEALEREALWKFYHQQQDAFLDRPQASARIAADESADSRLAAWVLVARVVLNLDETITRE